MKTQIEVHVVSLWKELEGQALEIGATNGLGRKTTIQSMKVLAFMWR
jgi:hypothetical protein